ncbi:hypothetical protein ACLB2K_039350 [Fragaria x ananassa]
MHQHQIQDSQLTDQSRLYHQLYGYASEGRQTDFITAIQKVADHDQNASMQLLSRLSHAAVTFGHVSLAIEILKLHPSLLLVKNFEGDTVLHFAAKTGEGDDNMIRYIMEHVNLGSGQGQVMDIEKVDISVFRMKNYEENTPLHEALINGNHLEAKYFIKADPSVSFGFIPLHFAASTDSSGTLPIHSASSKGHVHIVKLLLEHYPKKKGISCERMNNQLVKGKTLDSITSSSEMEKKGLDVEADGEYY